jgi:hypothetical protein
MSDVAALIRKFYTDHAALELLFGKIITTDLMAMALSKKYQRYIVFVFVYIC